MLQKYFKQRNISLLILLILILTIIPISQRPQAADSQKNTNMSETATGLSGQPADENGYTISGRVTTPTGDPLVGVWVILESVPYKYFFHCFL